jgi:hypothetical protein
MSDDEQLQLFRQAKNQLYRIYLVELYGEISHQVVEFDTYSSVFQDSHIQIKIEKENMFSPLSSSNMIARTPQPEYTENDPILPTTYDEANEDEMLIRGGFETQTIKVKKSFWRMIVQALSLVFPIFIWLPEYCKKSEILSNIKRDVLAGCTIAIILCPQGLAYAMVAGMPPIYGLYTAFIPAIIYPFLGTSRIMAIGYVTC